MNGLFPTSWIVLPSCAWRHCGAEADAQEALAELNNLSGVLEPFECEFIIDIVDRSLRDMIAMIPPIYLQPERVTLYQPYESKVRTTDSDDHH